MTFIKTFKYRLEPTKEQIDMLKQHGGNVRFVWNQLLDYSNNYKKINGKYPSQSELQKYILTLKSVHEFLKVSHSQPVQVTAQRLVKTFVKAYSKEIASERRVQIAKAKQEQDPIKREKKLAKAMNYGMPKFKSKNKQSDNIFYPQGYKVKKSQIFFPKLGLIKYIKHRELEGKPLSLTIVQEGNKYYVSISCEVKIKEQVKPEIDKANIVGIDVGLETFAVLSDGTTIKNPRTLRKHLKKLKREQKRLSKKQYDVDTKKSSNNRMKQVYKVRKVHEKVKNIRKDFLHNTSHDMITKYDGIIIEHLDIKGMLQGKDKGMNRSISDVSWYEFGRQVRYKSEWNSKYFQEVDQYFPSTRRCSNCGHLKDMTLKDREYICPCCGAVMGRDYNSALNIKQEGIRLIKDTVATTGIYACGLASIDVGMKQEKVVERLALAKAGA